MTDLLDGYEHQIVPGAGLSVSAGRPKVVLHTTETGRGSIDPLIAHWRGNWGAGLPHFIVEGARVVQLLPLSVGAYTLENAPGGADTNRSGPAVQAEVISFSASDWDDETYTTVGNLLADVKRAGHDFDLGAHPRWYGANEGVVLAAYNSPVRMSAQEYVDFNGWCAHQHVPENAHWDCGAKDTARIERIARARLVPHTFATVPFSPAPPIAPPSEEEPMTVILMREDGDPAVYAVHPTGRYHVADLGRWAYQMRALGAVIAHPASADQQETDPVSGLTVWICRPGDLVDIPVTA